MIERLQQYIEGQFSITPEQTVIYAQRLTVTIAALMFVLVATVIIAFDSIFLRFNTSAGLEIGQISPRNIVAPSDGSYVSEVLTETRREEARSSVQPIYATPDLDTARTWFERAEQTLDYIDDIRASGRYATPEQQMADLREMEYLFFTDEDHMAQILSLDEDTWSTIVAEVDAVLQRVYRTSIREEQAQNYINTQLALQISSTFDNRIRDLIFDIVDDFVKPNTFENAIATEEERERAAAAVEPEQRTFASGQIIIGRNERIDELAYEALVAFNLIQPEDLRVQQFARALIASTITLVIFGLYIARFSSTLLYHDVQRLTLIGVIFLLMLALTRLLGVSGDIHLFPTAAMALLFVAIADDHIAIITSLGLAFLVGVVANDSLEVATLIGASGLIGTLVLRRAENLNQFFVAGVLISATNAAVTIIFNLSTTNAGEGNELLFTIGAGLLNGFLAAAIALVAMYVVSQLFNMTTLLKLNELQQPNKPLLQRLLREAPGTYQHSLQVGNLAEQAANAIGADAQLTQVAALYHDIGKMQNPLYFTENQQDIAGNPHDTLNDPYRSADIIISHVTEGDEMAKQARLPHRIRDFIREHHGTTQVYVFYQRALNAVDGNEDAVDISDFTYPGPKPRSRETAILMLADSCEAAVRSVKPTSKQEIRDLISKIIDGKRSEGQLDESGLTLNDLRTIREIFVDILQGMFHPRINYREAVGQRVEASTKVPAPQALSKVEEVSSDTNGTISVSDQVVPRPANATQVTKSVEEKKAPSTRTAPKLSTTADETTISDEEPIAEVPRLPSLDERRASSGTKNTEESFESSDEKSDEETENATES